MIEETRKNLVEFIETTKKSQRQIAKETNLSVATISQFIKGNYQGNNEEIAKCLNQYLTVYKQRLNAVKTSEFNLNLYNTQRVLFGASFAHVNNKIAIIYGDAGAGKTTALKHYAETNTGVIYITANASSKTAKSILYMISEAINETPASSEFLLMRSLVSHFKGTNQLIIIDEADHLNPHALQAIRNLNDEAGVGLVLSGNDRIYYQMYGRGSLQFDQLRTRIGAKVKVTNDYTLEEIKEIFPNLDEQCSNYILKIACKESLRIAEDCYTVALQYATSLNVPLTLQNLKATQKDLLNETF